jgi:hypothetical protein
MFFQEHFRQEIVAESVNSHYPLIVFMIFTEI